VAAAWPKGIVAEPTASQQAGWWLADNLPSVVAGGGLALVLVFYAYAWLKFGRDPPRGTIVPLFGPPDGMSAAAVRFVENMGFDPRCFTAAIIDLGVSGHIRLTGDGRQTVIEHRDGGQAVAPPEQALESKLFAAKPSLMLTHANYEPLDKARDALKERLAQAYDGTLFTDNYLWSGAGMVLSILVLAATILLMSPPTTPTAARSRWSACRSRPFRSWAEPIWSAGAGGAIPSARCSSSSACC
jgi:hypothetical protein